MNYKGVEFTVFQSTTPGFWKWRFQIGEEVRTGKTETKIYLLAVRRVQMRIDHELRELVAKSAHHRAATQVSNRPVP